MNDSPVIDLQIEVHQSVVFAYPYVLEVLGDIPIPQGNFGFVTCR